jgi:N-acetylneuraminic acid mutarotase
VPAAQGTPVDIAVDPNGNFVYVATSQRVIIKLSSGLTAPVTTTLSSTPTAIAANNNFIFVTALNGDVFKLTPGLVVTSTTLPGQALVDVASDDAGNNIVLATSGGRVIKISSGLIETAHIDVSAPLVALDVNVSGLVAAASSNGGVFVVQPGLGSQTSTNTGAILSDISITPNGNTIYAVGAAPQASPTLTVTPAATTTPVGSSLTATAMLSGGNSPTGTITFRLYSPSAPTCSGTPVFLNTVNVSGNGTYSTSSAFIANALGTWHWTANYSGDASNNPASSACAAAVTVIRRSPSLSTTANPASAPIGSTLNAQAQLSNGYQPTGTITFRLYSSSDAACSSTPAFQNAVTVNGNATYSTSSGFTVNALGTWHWTATYSGDANNNLATSACAAAAVAVTKASPSINTTPNPASGTSGATLNDNAALSAGYTPTGTITFRLYPPSDATCSGAPSFTNTANVSGNATYTTSSGFTANALGTWHWTASYSGDVNNNSVSSNCAAEPVALKVSPSLTTTPNPVTCTICTTVNDAATLSGGNTPTGTITFNLYSPSDATCSGAPSFTNSVPVNGNGSYNTSSGFLINRAGTWRWTASYSGDGTNNPATSGCAAEPVTVTGNFWVTKAPMPSTRRALGVGVVNGILYTIGGLSTSNSAVPTVESYDPATNSWTTRAPMPTARYGLAVGVVNGIIYAVGGSSGGVGSQLPTVEAYDPATNTWTAKASMPTARAALAVGVVNNLLYAVGGFARTGSHVATLEEYNPLANTWTTKAPMPTARSQFAVGVSSGVLFAIGGSTSSTFFATVEAYNPSLNTWTTRAPMPTPRYQIAAGVVNGIVYVVGGLTATNATVATNEAYDPATDSWTTVAPMPTGRPNLSVGVIACLLYAIDGGFTTRNEAYQP